jgi:hypothetical protein
MLLCFMDNFLHAAYEVECFHLLPCVARDRDWHYAGIRMDSAAVTSALNACLLTDAELALGVDGWASYEDPFKSLAAPLESSDGNDDDSEGWESADSDEDGEGDAADDDSGMEDADDPEDARKDTPEWKDTVRFVRISALSHAGDFL